MYKKKELQLSYFSICEGKKLDDKIVTYFALKAGSTVLAFGKSLGIIFHDHRQKQNKASILAA